MADKKSKIVQKKDKKKTVAIVVTVLCLVAVVGLFFLNPIFTMILAFGDYTYRGVPQDGTSYDQMKGKYEDFSKKEQARNANVHYTAPDQNKGQENVTYRSPEETDEK